MITIEEQEAAFTSILEAVSGIKKHFTDFPDALQARQLPCVITAVRDATYDRDTYGADNLMIRRQWQAVVIVMLAVEGREFQPEQEAKPFLTSVPLALAAHPTITISDGGDHDGNGFQVELHQGGDRGARPISYNGKQYIGSVFTFYTIVEDTVDPVDAL